MIMTEMRIKSFNDLKSRIPKIWQDAEIGLCGFAFEPILRVSFHEHANGRRVILLHKKEMLNLPKEAEK